MKKIIKTVAALSLVGVLAACGNSQAEVVEDSEKSAEVDVKTVNVALKPAQSR